MNGPEAGPSRQDPPTVPLEVSGSSSLTQKLAITSNAKKALLKPDMSQMPVKASALLSQVRAFLPTMAQAQADLEAAISKDPALKDRLDIENVEGQERVIEMNLGLMPQSDGEETEEVPESKTLNSRSLQSLSPSVHSSSEWTVDSDPDSPPSPLKSDQDNGFTSDTDSDSTISTSSGSLSSGGGNCSAVVASTPSASGKSHKKSSSKKRPLIQELGSPGLAPSHNFPSETEENKRARYSMSVQQ